MPDDHRRCGDRRQDDGLRRTERAEQRNRRQAADRGAGEIQKIQVPDPLGVGGKQHADAKAAAEKRDSLKSEKSTGNNAPAGIVP